MTKLTDLTAVTTPATGDFAYVADVSDTTDDAAGSSKKITLGNLKVGNVFDADYGAVTVSSGVWAIDGAPSGAFVGTTDTQTLSNKTLTSPTIGTSLIFDGVTVTGLSGTDVTIVTGTAGSTNEIAVWDANGDAISSGTTVAELAALSGATFSGAVDFSGTGYIGLTVQTLTEAQRDALSPGNGAICYNSTAGQVQVYYGSAWRTVGFTELADPGADAVSFWDDSAGAEVYSTTNPPLPYTVNAQTGTSYTLALADINAVVTMSNASANTLTIPTNASVAFPTGTVIEVVMLGSGTTSVAGDTGVTLNGVSAGSGDLSAQYGAVRLLKIGTDTWIASGAIGTVA